MKKILCLMVCLFLAIIVAGCENEHNANRRRAEEIALDLVRGSTFHLYHTIERTIYNEETEIFSVYVSPREEGGNEIRVDIRFLENGSHWVDRARLNEGIRGSL